METADTQQEHHPNLRLWPSLLTNWHLGACSPLGRRISLLTVLSGTLLAIAITGIQLYAEYRRDLSKLDQSVAKIQLSLVPSLEESLWIIDHTLVQRQLEGMVQLEGVGFAGVSGADGRAFSAGVDANDRYGRSVAIPLSYDTTNGPVELGSLNLFISYEALLGQTVRRAAFVLGTNLVKTVIVAGIILTIYQRLVGRHLSQLAGFAESYDPSRPGVQVVLARPKAQQDDELEKLARALNGFAGANQLHIERLVQAKESIEYGNRELAAFNKQLYAANREQAEFTYAISHDLKSPTNTMGMLIEELRTDFEIGEDGQRVLEDMRATNRRMARLIEDVSGYSRIIEEKPKAEVVDLNEVVEQVLADLAADIASADAVILKESLPSIVGHPIQMRILMQNLIANAVKFRSPERKARVEIKGRKLSNGAVELSVADNGIGIAKEHRERVFGLFQRLHSSSVYQGTGLGLTICNRILAKHNGKIKLTEGIDGGTKCLVRIGPKHG